MSLSRDARKAETRDALVRAAARLFAKHGIEATSLDKIAAEVGLTKGAIYAHFAKKDDLVLAVATAIDQDPGQALITGPLFDGSKPFADRMREMAQGAATIMEEGLLGLSPLETILLDLEFFLHSLRTSDDAIQREIHRGFEAMGKQLEAIQKERGEPLALPGATVIPLGSNLTRGLALAHHLAPDLVPTSIFERIYLALNDLFIKKSSGRSKRKTRTAVETVL